MGTTPEEQKRLRMTYSEEEAPEEAVKEDVKEDEEEVPSDSEVVPSPVERTMIKFLRYNAFDDNLLDNEDWIKLDDSVLRRLGPHHGSSASWEEVVEVVRTS